MKQILKIIIFVILAMNVYCLTAQGAIGLSASLDNKLSFLADDYGNEPFTFDGTFKFSMQGYQKEYGFTQISVKYEFADLAGGELHRYGAEVGYTFTNGALGVMPFGGYGILKREWGYARTSFEFGGVVSLRIFKQLKFITSIVWTERTDLPAVGFRMNMNTGVQFDFDTNYLNL